MDPMKKKLEALGPDLRTKMIALYRGLGIECPIREIEESIELEMLGVFKVYIRRQTANVLGVPTVSETEAEDE